MLKRFLCLDLSEASSLPNKNNNVEMLFNDKQVRPQLSLYKLYYIKT